MGVTEGTRARRGGAFATLACALSVLSLLILGRCVLAMTYLNIRFHGEVDPLSRAVSYYVFAERAAEVFVATLVAVATAALAILAGLAQLRVRLGPRAVALLIGWSAALLLCAAFPTDDSPRIETASGWIHQFAGASLFVTLPLACLAAATSLREQHGWAGTAALLRRLAIGAVVLASAYLVARLPDLVVWWQFPGVLDFRAVSGLVQRGLFALELAMLLALATRLLRVSWSAARRVGRHRPQAVAR